MDLNADHLDAKSEADFYTAGGKVADSELLEGKDSLATFSKSTPARWSARWGCPPRTGRRCRVRSRA